MGRFISITVVIVIILLFVLLFMVFTSQRPAPTAEAVRIALSDPDIQASIRNHSGNVSIDGLTELGVTKASGYFNVRDQPVQVMLLIGDYILGVHNIVYVDLGCRCIVDREQYTRTGIPASIDVTIPPGAGWYHKLNGPTWSGRMVNGTYEATNGTEKFVFRLKQIEPSDAKVYPSMVNETNLYRLMNNTPYEAATYLDDYTKSPASTDGSAPLDLHWWLNASVERPLLANAPSWPAFDRNEQYYLVLINKGATNANMSLSQEMEAFQQSSS